MTGVLSIEPIYLDVAKAFGASKKDFLTVAIGPPHDSRIEQGWGRSF